MAESSVQTTSQPQSDPEYKVPRPEVGHLITEDDTPVDSWFVEKQQRLLVEPLYASWMGLRDNPHFIVAANVGLYASVKQDPVVPDMFLSVGVKLPDDLWDKGNRVYFFWEYGKPPDVVIKIISNSDSNKDEMELLSDIYCRMRVFFYVVFDPFKQIQEKQLTLYALKNLHQYEEISPTRLDGLELGLTLWEGTYEGMKGTWLRWQDDRGNLVLTGKERADQIRHRAELQRKQAELEKRIDKAEIQATLLVAKLRELGINPDDVVEQ